MADSSVKMVRDLLKAREDIAKKCYPAYDELLKFALSRQHLDSAAISDIIIDTAEKQNAQNLKQHLMDDVRLVKIDEISQDKEDRIHLPGVESAITSMRGRGFSLLFIVQGDSTKTSIYLGLSRFADSNSDINAALESYSAAWLSNFPGSKLHNLSTKESSDVSFYLADCKEFGVLTGIPSLKRDEDSDIFVQGIERLIRAMRGKTYCWISIADPLPNTELNNAIDACQNLQSEIHHLVKTDLSKATSNGKTVTFGLFGMLGQGETAGAADTVNEIKTHGTSEAATHTVGGSVFASTGGTVGFLGSNVHVEGGASVDYHYSKMHGIMESLAKGVANTISNAITKQLGGGAFSSFGVTWNKTTTVGEELLNRKMEYAEEILQKYEERLHLGTALGMWNLGNYFCAADENTYNQGIGIVTSLFTGMDSTHEPPRAIKMPVKFRDILRRFNNIYLHFENTHKSGDRSFTNHPLGFIFNGPGTPVNTKELAIATPIATQDVEGVTVTERVSFGINISNERANNKSLTIGTILDKGNVTKQRYFLGLESLPKHLAVFGLTGSGKTNTVHNLLMQLWKRHHIPFLVIEPAKAEYRALAESDELKDDLLIISAGVDQTGVCPLRLNPFYFAPGKDNDANRVHVLTHIDRLKATFNASFPMYASMPYILEEAILEIYRERGWDLGRSVNRYVDIYKDDFCDFVPTLQDLFLKVDAIVTRKGYFQEQQMNIQAALKARLSSLMVGAKGSMFNCLHSIPAKELFERPTIIELENMGDDDEKAFLMGLLVSKLYEYRKTTATGSDDLKHVLVIEEAHRLLANVPDSADMEVANVKGKAVSAFVDMLSEIRAFGQSVFVIDQLPSRVSPNIVKGTGAKIVHRLLAKDDREAVGWTMGMNDEQINDLSLLRTGECVVSQDGDRKSFMCKVQKNELHEQRHGGEISEKTSLFKQENAAMFESLPDEIDREDVKFHDEFYAGMLAVGCGQSSDILARIMPSCKAKVCSELPLAVWQKAYWQHISREIWGFFGGEFDLYIALRTAGESLISDPQQGLENYRISFENYFKNTKQYLYAVNTNLGGSAFSQYLNIKKCFETLNRYYDAIKDSSNVTERVGNAIRKVMPLIAPHSFTINPQIFDFIALEIIFRVAPQLSSDEIMAYVKGGK